MDGDKISGFAKEVKDKEKISFTYLIQSEREQHYLKNAFTPGITCKVSGFLKRPQPPTNDNAFSYPKYLEAKRIHWILNIEKIEFASCQKGENTPLTILKRLRHQGVEYLSLHFPKETAPLAAALIFGDRHLMDDQLLDDYQDIGITHLLAISGLNVSMLVGIIFYLGIRFGVTRESMTKWLLIALPIYMILTGASPSVNRACIMMIIILLMNRWRFAALNILDLVSLAFLLYVTWSPLIILDVGFQLSFSVTFSLILSSTLILKSISHPIIILMVISFISQMAATPIILYNFYEISLISLLANLIFVPLFSSVFSPVILLLFLLHLLLQDLITPIVMLFNVLVIFSNTLTTKIGQIPYSTIILGKPGNVQLFFYILGTFIFFTLWERKRKPSDILKLLFIPIALFVSHGICPYFSSDGEVTFVDIGQGDSILVTLPFRKGVYLIDTGGTQNFSKEKWRERKSTFEVGEDVLVPYLKSKGIGTIDKLILTHGDLDHIGGAISVIKELKIKEIVLPVTWEQSNLEATILQLARKYEISIKFVQAGDSWRRDKTTFSILSPKGIVYSEKNDGSIVIHTNLGGISWIFTGDLEESGEKELVKRYPNLRIDVLKVGHHGSKTSTSELLLDSLQPKAAVISVGRDNRFGHPHSEVVKRLNDRRILLFRTDENGAVTYRFNRKEKGTFLTVLP